MDGSGGGGIMDLLSTLNPQREGGANMQNLLNFLISIMASVAGNYISKWLNRDKKDS